MDIYQLDYVLHEPEESEGWMYLAEIPALQGCMAWGQTPEETLQSLAAVAQTIIQIRRENKEPLPPEITPLRSAESLMSTHFAEPSSRPAVIASVAWQSRWRSDGPYLNEIATSPRSSQ